jgi:hypothetical protein
MNKSLRSPHMSIFAVTMLAALPSASPAQVRVLISGGFSAAYETQHLRAGPPASRRAFVRSGLVATLATVVSPLAHSATWKETQARPQTSDTALTYSGLSGWHW